MATNTYAQKTIGSRNGPNVGPHQAVRKTQKELETLRERVLAIGRAKKDVVLRINDRVKTVEADLEDLRSFEAKILSSIKVKKDLQEQIKSKEDMITAYEAEQGQSGLSELASQIPDDVGRRLLSICAAYVGTDAYMDMAVAHSQQAPGDNFTGFAATELARRLEAQRIDHERVLLERDQTISSLRAELASAKNEVASGKKEIQSLEADLALVNDEVAAARESKVALEEQKKAAESLRKSEQQTLTLWRAATDEVNRLKSTIQGLEDGKSRLKTDLEVVKTRLETADALCLTRKAALDETSDLLTTATREIGKLTVDGSAKDEEIRTLKRRVEGAALELSTKLDDASKDSEDNHRRKTMQVVLKHKGEMEKLRRAHHGEVKALQASLKAAESLVTKTHESNQRKFERLEELQKRWNDQVSANKDICAALAAKETDIATLTSERKTASALLKHAEAELSASEDRVRQLETAADADKKSLELLRQSEQTRLSGLATYFATSCATVTNLSDNGWTAFARAVQTSCVDRASGAFPGPTWSLVEAWDVDDATNGKVESCPLAQVTLDLYGAFRAGVWTNQVANRLSMFTDAMAQTDSANVAVVELLVREAIRATAALNVDTLTVTAYMCGMGICQALFVIRARWPQLLSENDITGVQSHLRSLHVLPIFGIVAYLVGGGDLAPSPHRLDQGQMVFLAQNGSSVSFIIDTAHRSIRAVSKRHPDGKRSGWKDNTTVVVRAPPGQHDVLIECNSHEAFNWLIQHWLS